MPAEGPPARPPEEPPTPDGSVETAEPLGSWEAPEVGSQHDSVWTRGPAVDAAADSSVVETASGPVTAPTRSGRPAPVLPPPSPSQSSRRRVIRRVRRPATLVVGVAAVVVAGVLAWSFGLVGGDETADPAVASESSAVDAPTTPVSVPTTVPATTIPDATIPVTTVPATTVPTTTMPATTVPATTAPSTTAPAPTIPVTTSAPTPAADGPRVAASGRVGPCSFGPSCLIVDFSIAAFATPQREFVCEFADGGRYTFRFDGAGATGACSTSAADGAITIEVGGVRSETITR